MLDMYASLMLNDKNRLRKTYPYFRNQNVPLDTSQGTLTAGAKFVYEGTNKGSEIQALLNAGNKWIHLATPNGSYTFDQGILLVGSASSNVLITSAPGATCIPPQQSSSAVADDGEASYLVRAIPNTYGTAGSTSLNVKAKRGECTLFLSTSISLVAGDYIRIEKGIRIDSLDTSTGTFTISEGVGFASNTALRLWHMDPIQNVVSGTMPSAYSTATVYYYIPISPTTFKLSTAAGPGAAVTGGTNFVAPLYITPNSAVEDSFRRSDAPSVQPAYVYQVAAISGTTVTTSQPLASFHQKGNRVRKISPVKNLVLDMELNNLNGFVSSMYRLESIVNGEIYGAGSGCTRAIIDACYGTRDSSFYFRHDGNNSAGFLGHTSVNNFVTGECKADVTASVNSRGIPRALVFNRHRPTDNLFKDLKLFGGHSCGFAIMGDQCSSLQDAIIRNMSSSFAGTRDPTVLYVGSVPYSRAPGLSVGQYDTPLYGEYTLQFHCDNVLLDNNRVEFFDPFTHWSAQAVISDVYNFSAGTIQCVNWGFKPSIAKSLCAGLALFDAFDYEIDKVETNGQYVGLIYYNVNSGDIRHLTLRQTTGESDICYGIGFVYPYIGSANRIGNMTLGVQYPVVTWALSGDDLGYRFLNVENAVFNADNTKSLFYIQNKTGATISDGELVELHSATMLLTNPTVANSPELYAVWGYGASSNFSALVSRTGDIYVTLAAATSASVGDKVVANPSASRHGIIDNTATSYFGRCLTTKSSGSAGQVLVRTSRG